MKDGFAPFEKTVEVKAGGEVAIDAKLEPLVNAGQLELGGGYMSFGTSFDRTEENAFVAANGQKVQVT